MTWEERMSAAAHARMAVQRQRDQQAQRLIDGEAYHRSLGQRAYNQQVTDEDFAFAIYHFLDQTPEGYYNQPRYADEDSLRRLLIAWLEYHPGYDFTPIAWGAA